MLNCLAQGLNNVFEKKFLNVVAPKRTCEASTCVEKIVFSKNVDFVIALVFTYYSVFMIYFKIEFSKTKFMMLLAISKDSLEPNKNLVFYP